VKDVYESVRLIQPRREHQSNCAEASVAVVGVNSMLDRDIVGQSKGKSGKRIIRTALSLGGSPTSKAEPRGRPKDRLAAALRA